MIAIDEPEISLNVAWQQHYTDLILKSLIHAPGTHVLIATHSPHLIASLPLGSASVVTIEKINNNYSFKTTDALFEGWGAEAVLYQVLGVTSASSFLFNRKLAKILKHIQDGGEDRSLIASFLDSAYKLDYHGIEPLEEVIQEIESYLGDIS
ncbi:ATP-binding protein [Pseudomonas sp. MAFF 311096]|uniref:ATP-binding protein n=1 Tax=Pseudomonas petroselini TaxID=2899822 RepID=A0ABS8QWM0_9PSED|nr:ATP-binding protein [Pseudomonas petroselini]MCD7040136.1 ATP-binding protein [Pseudomonas petroselini]